MKVLGVISTIVGVLSYLTGMLGRSSQYKAYGLLFLGIGLLLLVLVNVKDKNGKTLVNKFITIISVVLFVIGGGMILSAILAAFQDSLYDPATYYLLEVGCPAVLGVICIAVARFMSDISFKGSSDKYKPGLISRIVINYRLSNNPSIKDALKAIPLDFKGSIIINSSKIVISDDQGSRTIDADAYGIGFRYKTRDVLYYFKHNVPWHDKSKVMMKPHGHEEINGSMPIEGKYILSVSGGVGHLSPDGGTIHSTFIVEYWEIYQGK